MQLRLVKIFMGISYKLSLLSRVSSAYLGGSNAYASGQSVPKGYFNLHYSRKFHGRSCTGVDGICQFESELACYSNSFPQVNSFVNPFPNGSFIPASECVLNSGICASNSEYSLGIQDDQCFLSCSWYCHQCSHYNQCNQGHQCNQCSQNPMMHSSPPDIMVLASDSNDDNTENMRINCYTEYSGPIYQHLICEKCLLKLLATKKLLNIECSACLQMINPRCITEYIKTVVLHNSRLSGLTESSQGLARGLTQEFVKAFNEEVFIFSLNINDSNELEVMKNYCEYVLGPFSNDIREKFERIIVWLEEEEQRTGPYVCKRAKTRYSAMGLEELYADSLTFYDSLSDEHHLDKYIDFVKAAGTELHCYHCYARVFFLLNNAWISVGKITNYLVPFLIGLVACENHPIRKYIEEYRNLYSTIESKQELALECTVCAKLYVPDAILNSLVMDYLRHDDISVERILKFVSRNINYCDLSLKNCQSLKILNRIIANVSSLFKPLNFYFKDFLELEYLIERHSGTDIKIGKLAKIRNRYLFRRSSLLDDILPDLKSKLREMKEGERLVSMNGILIPFDKRMLHYQRNSLFRIFCSDNACLDSRMFYLPQLARYNVISADNIFNLFFAFEKDKRLQISYLLGIVIYLHEELVKLESNRSGAYRQRGNGKGVSRPRDNRTESGPDTLSNRLPLQPSDESVLLNGQTPLIGHRPSSLAKQSSMSEQTSSLSEQTSLYGPTFLNDTLRSILEKYRDMIKTYKEYFKMYLLSPRSECQEICVVFGFTCHLNALITSLPAEYHKYKVDLAFIGKLHYSLIYTFLTKQQTISRVHLNRIRINTILPYVAAHM